MQFTTSAAAFLALISHVVAQTDGFDAISKPTSGEVLTAGSTFQVTWDYDAQYDGTISITLLEGKTAATLELGDTVASGIDNSAGSYTWTVGSDLGDYATYGLKITLDSDPSTFQYSFPFKIEASGSSSSTSSSISSSASSAAAAVTTAAAASSSLTSASPTISLASSTPSSAASTVPETSAAEPATTDMAETTAAATTATGVTKPSSTKVTKTTLTSVSSASSTGSSAGSGTSSSPSAVVTAGAGRVAAGTFVAMGGFVAALFAL